MTALDVQRERLLNRRLHEVVQFEHGGFTYVAGIGRFEDRRLAEIFLIAAKTGTAVEASARDAAIVASLALQFGVPLVTLQQALTRQRRRLAVEPARPITRSTSEQCRGAAVRRADLRLEFFDQLTFAS